MTLRPVLRLLLAAAFVVGAQSTAFADLTAFIGATSDPGTRATRGLAVGVSLIIIGFEFEYASAGGDSEDAPGCPGPPEVCKPSLTTGMFNGLLQTPRGLGPLQIYGTAGGGIYRERFDVTGQTNTSFGTNVGGGVKIELLGPLRLRLDYRVFRLTGGTEFRTPRRFYAGANLAF